MKTVSVRSDECNYEIVVPCRIKGDFTPVASIGIAVFRNNRNQRKVIAAWDINPIISFEEREAVVKLIEGIKNAGCSIEKESHKKKTKESKK